MIDLHTHILPEIDDGASSLEETREMVALAAADGITELVATPHWNCRFEFDPERCGREIERVRRACAGGPRLYLGCEVHFTFENIERLLAGPAHYTLNGGDCLLVELPDRFTAAAVEAGLKACSRGGLRIVIAHPERNPHLQRNPAMVARLVERGCYFQVTAESLSGLFGTAAQKTAIKMLKQRLAHFVASDCHDARQRRPLLRRAYNAIARDFGARAAELLFVLNPRSAVHSQSIQLMGQAMGDSTIRRLLSSINVFGRSGRWSPSA
jgi:protein-tyrosine phosphatase